MADVDQLDRLARSAEEVLRRQVEPAILLDEAELIDERGRSLVIRCRVRHWGKTRSVVIKLNTGDDARGFTDWAGLMFLSQIERAGGIGPRFYAGDPRARIIVMEDLGSSRSLADLLEASDEQTILDTLRALAVPMARLVVTTIGREPEYVRLRAALPGAAGLGRRHEAERWLAGRAVLARWADVLDVAQPAGFDAALRYIATSYVEPGPLLALSHGDPAPSNNHIGTEHVRLVDFEYGAYRHALYDITGWHILCPLPEHWVAALDEAFLRELATSGAANLVADERQYRESWATLCAYRALAMLTWFTPEVLDTDRPWAPGWSMRPALISTCVRLQQTASQSPQLRPLAEFGAALAARVQGRWPELGDGAPHWPGVTTAGLRRQP